MLIRRSSEANWLGRLRGGAGSISLASGAASPLPLSLDERKSESSAATSPEEMLAAAHAGCFAMSLRAVLDGSGAGESLADDDAVSVNATCVLKVDGPNWQLDEMILNVAVDGLDRSAVESAAAAADAKCPVSAALREHMRITIVANGD